MAEFIYVSAPVLLTVGVICDPPKPSPTSCRELIIPFIVINNTRILLAPVAVLFCKLTQLELLPYGNPLSMFR